MLPFILEHRENPFDDGTLGYYPFISLFNDAIVRLNPGPEFEYPPPPDINSFLDKQANPSMEEEELSDSQSSPTHEQNKKDPAGTLPGLFISISRVVIPASVAFAEDR